MEELTPTAWTVLRAARDVSDRDGVTSVDASSVRDAVFASVGNDATLDDVQAPGGTYAGIEAPLWSLESAGFVVIDVGMAPATAPGQAAHVVDDDYGVRITNEGREALRSREALEGRTER